MKALCPLGKYHGLALWVMLIGGPKLGLPTQGERSVSMERTDDVSAGESTLVSMDTKMIANARNSLPASMMATASDADCNLRRIGPTDNVSDYPSRRKDTTAYALRDGEMVSMLPSKLLWVRCIRVG